MEPSKNRSPFIKKGLERNDEQIRLGNLTSSAPKKSSAAIRRATTQQINRWNGGRSDVFVFRQGRREGSSISSGSHHLPGTKTFS
ncbi:hypothetical protein CEXT_150971 [Caerostris extrusa]|uniref:Uncharacterized protein n=1 Tax=Caerostris extrusa TaxID=172846 RepID=A0AAV4NR47_CAEEX|nr:hypothetical protein CEXT_150971 [Caerostris extrusa]